MTDPKAARATERVRLSLQRIGEQHGKILALRRTVESAVSRGDADAIADGIQRLSGTVEAHFELEERAYYPPDVPMEDPVADTLLSFIDQHESLRTELQTLRSLVAARRFDDFKSAFDAFCSTLADHEAREEKVISDLAGLR